MSLPGMQDSALGKHLTLTPGLDIKLVGAVARGASRFENLLAPLKTYWPLQKNNWPLPPKHTYRVIFFHAFHVVAAINFKYLWTLG